MIIRVNYNNAYVKQPKTISELKPELYFFKRDEVLYLYIDTKLSKEPYYTKYLLNIYINGKFFTNIDQLVDKEVTIDGVDYTISEVSDVHIIPITDREITSSYIVEVDVSGTYSNNTRSFDVRFPTASLTREMPIVSDSTYCNDDITVYDIIEGKLMEGVFYDMYNNPLTPDQSLYADLLTNKLYLYNFETNTYELI